jgi:hypothetical protein
VFPDPSDIEYYGKKEAFMPFHSHMNLTFHPVIAIAAGLAVLIQPRLLNYIVAFYLLFTGVVELLK